MVSWRNEDKQRDIVISSRVRLARNIKNMPFPVLLPEKRAMLVVESVESCLMNQKTLTTEFKKIMIGKIDAGEKKMLVEKHLTSPELGKHWGASVFISENEDVSIMVNEEDHVRIQCIKEGFQLQEAYNTANKVDDVLEECVEFAYHQKYGYLTSCPTNAGTGMRASVMLHLPTLTLNNQIGTMTMTLAKFGLTIRGIYGEGSQALGDLYQVSNQNTMGVTEQEIINTLHDVAKEIIKKERDIRYEILHNNRIFLEDKIFRAYGILTNARTMDPEESLKLLSLVRLGSDLELIDQDISIINRLMSDIQPGILAKTYKIGIEDADRDRIRAQHIRNQLIMD
ncbi:protein arginine kinase [Alkalibacter mobilis]|uniref:protein arginine kinase n=1 Tax=Alkalibacter mobilis TaxID=2787712 RepID=UPI00189E876B|nr:protein arginine kinase [Alkalibacter mobilis]MBF7096416.1 protein arginine kinase [Alkalibacter mobilis]